MKWKQLCSGCGRRRVHLWRWYGGRRCRGCMILAGVRTAYPRERAAWWVRRPVEAK